MNTTCPRHVELRWKTEVSSSIFATPLIADINSDGKLEVVVSSFVHYLEVLEGSDGDKLPGWPGFHQSKAYSSPLLYDIDKDGTREITLATYNGIINFFRVSGYLMTDKLEVPRRKVPHTGMLVCIQTLWSVHIQMFMTICAYRMVLTPTEVQQLEALNL